MKKNQKGGDQERMGEENKKEKKSVRERFIKQEIKKNIEEIFHLEKFGNSLTI